MSAGFFCYETPSPAPDGATFVFSASQPYPAGTLALYIGQLGPLTENNGGIIEDAGAGTFTVCTPTAPGGNEPLFIRYHNPDFDADAAAAVGPFAMTIASPDLGMSAARLALDAALSAPAFGMTHAADALEMTATDAAPGLGMEIKCGC